MASERELETTPHTRAVNSCNDRFFQRLQPVQKRLSSTDGCVYLLLGAKLLEQSDIGTGQKVVRFTTDQDSTFQLRLALDPVESGSEVIDHGPGNRIHPGIRRIQPDDHHAILYLEHEIAHAPYLSTIVA